MGRLKRQVYIDVLLIIVMSVVLATGYILDLHLIERPGRGIVKLIHTCGGYGLTVLVALHLIEYLRVLRGKIRVLNK